MKTGADLLRAWRGKRSQAEVAELLGVNQGTVSRLEAGEYEPGVALAIRLDRLSDGTIPVSAWVPTRRATG
jgi:DNA-binding XRE family transcriptional regulator